MLEFICLFFPTCISIYVIKKQNPKMKKEDYLISYVFYNMIINSIVLFLVLCSNKFQYMVMTFSPLFALEYIVLACFLAYILPVLKEHIKHNISITIKKNEKRIKHEKK